jgi:hypothetical protein
VKDSEGDADDVALADAVLADIVGDALRDAEVDSEDVSVVVTVVDGLPDGDGDAVSVSVAEKVALCVGAGVTVRETVAVAVALYVAVGVLQVLSWARRISGWAQLVHFPVVHVRQFANSQQRPAVQMSLRHQSFAEHVPPLALSG